MSRDLQQKRDHEDKSKAGAEVDVDAEHNPEVARRSSNASLRREMLTKGSTGGDSDEIHAAAERGTATPGSKLPHYDKIQAAFGDHDISHVQAHIDGSSTKAIGAEAYATGSHVVFAQQPDLHTAAHEAAHVVQQQGGVQLKGGVGTAGDSYERQADAVADRVVQGKSATDLLGAANGNKAEAGPVQKKEKDKAPVDKKAAHQASDSKSYDSVQSALKHLAKQFHVWFPQLDQLRNSKSDDEAGVEPAVQSIQAIYTAALDQVERVGELISTANKSDAKTLASEVKQVQGAAFIFVNHMAPAQQWVGRQPGHEGESRDPGVILKKADALTARIGIDGDMDQDRKAPKEDELSLMKSVVDDDIEALGAAISSVEAGNKEDASRITLHARHLDNFAASHGLRIKTKHDTLVALKKQLDALRASNSELDLNEASNHLRTLVAQ